MINAAPQRQVSLQHCHTLAMPVSAEYFYVLQQADELPELLQWAEQQQLPWLIVGGGSNVLFRCDVAGLVVQMATSGKQLQREGENVVLDVAAGENWHQLVCWTLQQGYYGLENLVLIPGTVGAAPIQNIGAYGVELATVLDSVYGWDVEQRQWRRLDKEQCQFAYRDSIFKQSLAGRFVITSVRLILSTRPAPVTHYGSLATALKDKAITNPTPGDVARLVTELRQSKLPDPAQIPNAGSFFKNPVLSAQQAAVFCRHWPTAVSYPMPDGGCKLAAAWLIEQTGWKGRIEQGVGMHSEQALVLVNPGHAAPELVLAVAAEVQQAVYQQFGIELQIEPAILP